jgi:hypothetical protein
MSTLQVNTTRKKFTLGTFRNSAGETWRNSQEDRQNKETKADSFREQKNLIPAMSLQTSPFFGVPLLSLSFLGDLIEKLDREMPNVPLLQGSA